MNTPDRPFARTADMAQTVARPDVVARHIATAQTLLQRARPQDLDRVIPEVLSLIGRAMGAGRAYVCQIRDEVFLDCTHEWCAPGVAPMKARLQKVAYSDGDPFWTMFRRSGSVIIPDLRRFDSENPLRQMLDHDIDAFIATALWKDQQVSGLVAFDFTNGPRTFAAREDVGLRGLAASIALALECQHLNRKKKRLEDALSATEARLAASISRAPKLLVEVDHEGIITAFFQPDPIIFALNPQEVIGASPEQVLPPQVAEIVRRAMAEVDRFGWSQSHTYALDLDGAHKWFSLSAIQRKAQSPDRKASGYIFVVTDVSDARQQDTRIRQLVRVAELSTNLIMLTDSKRQVTWANPAVETRIGLALDQIVGKKLADVLGPAQADPGWIADLCARLDSGQSVNEELVARFPRGVHYWLDLNIQPLRSPDDMVQGFMVVGVDVTQHKLAEARALRDKVRTLDASKEGYAIFWPDGRVAFMNAELRRILGLQHAGADQALLWSDLAHSEFVTRLTAILPELIDKGYWSGEFSVTSPDGPARHSDISLTVQDDGSIFLVLRDITDRKAAEAERLHLHTQLQIAQSRQVMSHMAAGLAHDFANLLSVIGGSLDFLDGRNAQAQAAALSRIRLATAQAQNLVQDLMQFGRVAPRRARVDIQDIACRALDMIRPSLSAPVVTRLVAPLTALVMVDPTQVMQVVVNLALNADTAIRSRHDGAANGRITLSFGAPSRPPFPLPPIHVGRLSPGRRYVAMTIADTGPGISAQVRSSLFSPFATSRTGERGLSARSDDAPESSGTGLGLAIVAHVVDSHDAALSVGQTTDEGAEITIFWPIDDVSAPDDAAATCPAEAMASPRPLEGLNILLVDDDDRILQTLSTLLTAAGAETVSCDRPLDALAAVTEDPGAWDVVITDHDMNRMNGVALAGRLRAIAPETAIVLLTGAGALHFASDHAHDLFAAVLRKPVSGPELIAVLLREKLRNVGRMTRCQDQHANTDRR